MKNYLESCKVTFRHSLRAYCMSYVNTANKCKTKYHDTRTYLYTFDTNNDSLQHKLMHHDFPDSDP